MSETTIRRVIHGLMWTGLAFLIAWSCVTMLPNFTAAAPVLHHAARTATQQGEAQTAGTADPVVICGEFGCVNSAQTPEEAEQERQATIAVYKAIWHWFTDSNWIWITGAFLWFVGLWWMLLRWMAKREAETIRNPKEAIVNGQTVKLPGLTCEGASLILPNDPRFAGLSFDSIIGQEEAKIEIQEILDFLKDPGDYAHMEAKLPRGVLMYGTHGVGKTMFVRILAAILGFPIIEISGSGFVQMYVGVGAQRVRALYHDADELVKIYGACLVFIDEMDSVGRKRGGDSSGGSTETESTLNQLLKEMDPITPRPRVLTFGATNRLDILDPAILRPGRFDRKIEFFNPNKYDRVKFIEMYLPTHLREPDIDLMSASKSCVQASGADMANIANEAKLMTARVKLTKVTATILDEAIQRTMHGARRDSQRKVLCEQELRTLEWHEAGHALLAWLLTGIAPLRFTIIPRGLSGGHVEFSEEFEMLRTKAHLEARLIIAMGGYAATFVGLDGQEDTGISSDYDQATEQAIQMVTVYGLSQELGPVALNPLKRAGLVSDAYAERNVQEIKAMVTAAQQEAVLLMNEHLDDLRKLVAEVREHETLLPEDFHRLFVKPKTSVRKDDGKTITSKDNVVPMFRRRSLDDVRSCTPPNARVAVTAPARNSGGRGALVGIAQVAGALAVMVPWLRRAKKDTANG